ncbi:MAG: hypothetical protein CMG93_09750 [Marinomonas sp.]|nr:hypothetical protein [Marinomonas sp.]
MICIQKMNKIIEAIRNDIPYYESEISQHLMSQVHLLLENLEKGFVLGSGKNSKKSNSISMIVNANIGEHFKDLSERLAAEGYIGLRDINLTQLDYRSKSTKDIVDKLNHAYTWRSNHIANDLHTSDISFIRLIFLHIHSYYKVKYEKQRKVCKYCFRVALSRNTCHLHNISVDHKNRYEAEKISAQIAASDKAKESMQKYRDIRKNLSLSSPLNSHDTSLIDALPLLRDAELIDLKKTIEKEIWPLSQTFLKIWMSENTPKVYEKLQNQFSKACSFNDFVRIAYEDPSLLDNRYDFFRSFEIFIMTLLRAEIWFIAEELANKAQDKRKKSSIALERDQKILELRHSNADITIREIAELVSCGKSTVSKVLKSKSKSESN